MKKVNQKKFIKLSRRFFTEKEIKKAIDFMREHNGRISYSSFVVFLSMYNAGTRNYCLDKALDKLEQLGCSHVAMSINLIVYGK